MKMHKEHVTKPDRLIRLRLQVQRFRRLNWTRELKARIAPIWTHDCNWPWQWGSIQQRHRCPSLKANYTPSRYASMLIPKQRRLFRGELILNLRGCLCVPRTRINESSKPTIIPP